MKAAEILRSLIDIIAREEERESQSNQPVVININNGQEETTSDETGVMVPPLQQKIELMTKSQGIDSVYDDNEDEEDEPDELDILKRSAGIRNLFDEDDDEPFQG